MKTKLFFLTLVVAFAVLASCSHKEQQEEAKNWKELDSFHKIMAAAFHPLKDSGNVEPATKLMDSLANEAERWAAAPLPEKVNNDHMKMQLNKLKTDLRNLSNEIKDGAPEDQIGTTFHEIHEQFHHIMEMWNGEKHEEGAAGKEDHDDDDGDEEEHEHH